VPAKDHIEWPYVVLLVGLVVMVASALHLLSAWVDWFCEMAQKPPMTCEKSCQAPRSPSLVGCCFTCQELVDGTYILYQGRLSHEMAELTLRLPGLLGPRGRLLHVTPNYSLSA
jgi:hypothetical protein